MNGRVYVPFLRFGAVVCRRMLLPQASLTGPIVELCVNVINDTGLWGVFLAGLGIAHWRARRQSKVFQ